MGKDDHPANAQTRKLDPGGSNQGHNEKGTPKRKPHAFRVLSGDDRQQNYFDEIAARVGILVLYFDADLQVTFHGPDVPVIFGRNTLDSMQSIFTDNTDLLTFCTRVVTSETEDRGFFIIDHRSWYVSCYPTNVTPGEFGLILVNLARKNECNSFFLPRYPREVFDCFPEAIITSDSEMNVFDWNKSTEGFFDYSPSDLCTLSLKDLFHGTSKEHLDRVTKVCDPLYGDPDVCPNDCEQDCLNKSHSSVVQDSKSDSPRQADLLDPSKSVSTPNESLVTPIAHVTAHIQNDNTKGQGKDSVPSARNSFSDDSSLVSNPGVPTHITVTHSSSESESHHSIQKGTWQPSLEDKFRTFAIRKDKTQVPVECSIVSTRVHDTVYYTTYVQDISSVLTTEEMMASFDEISTALQTIINRSGIYLFAKDLHGNYTSVNESVREHFPQFDFAHKKDQEIFGKEYSDAFAAIEANVIEKGLTVFNEIQMPFGDVMHHFLATSTPRRGPNGDIIGLYAMVQDITDYKKALLEKSEVENQRAQLREQLAEQSSRLKSEFLATMSHEIRTPLNGIIGMLTLLEYSPLDEQQKDYVTSIRQSSGQLLSIVNDILDFSKIEAGKVDLELNDMDLSVLLHDISTMYSFAARQKGLAFQVINKVPPACRFVKSDNGRLRQILSNLINNAVKFTFYGSIRVRMSLRSERDPLPTFESDAGTRHSDDEETQASPGSSSSHGHNDREGSCAVSDKGGKAYRHLLKEVSIARGDPVMQIDTRGEYVRVKAFWPNPEKDSSPDGDYTDDTQLSDVDSCSCSSEQDAPEKSEQWVLFEIIDTGIGIAPDKVNRLFKPFTQAEESTTRRFGGTGLGLSICSSLVDLMKGRIGVVSEQGHGSNFWFQIPYISGKPPPVAPPTIASVHVIKNGQGSSTDKSSDVFKKNILVVEDNPMNRKVAVKLLNHIGFEVQACENGFEALHLLQMYPTRFSLVLMDLFMPIMNGYEAIDEIRKLPKPVGDIAVVAMTANAIPGEKERVIALGMDDYVAKPINADTLYGVVWAWVNRPHSAGPP